MQIPIKKPKDLDRINESLNLASLTLLFEEARKAEDYVRKLHTKLIEHEYCHKWAHKSVLAYKQVVGVYDEILADLDRHGALTPISKE